MLKKAIALCALQAALAAPAAMAAPAVELPPDMPAELRAQVLQQLEEASRTQEDEQNNVEEKKEDEVADNLATYKVIEKSRFMIAAKAADLDQIVPITKSDFPIITKMDYGQMFDFRKAENEALMNGSPLAQSTGIGFKTPAEKRAEIYDSYKTLITNLNETIAATDAGRFDEAKSNLARFNRYIISDSRIINQYPEPVTMTADEDFSGPAYLIFVAAETRHDYLIQAEDYIREYTASPNHTLDQKIVVLKALTEANVSKAAEDYMDKQVEEWTTKSYSTKDLDRKAKAMFLNHPDKDAIGKEYKEFVKDVNDAITAQEYDELPERITRAQYKALSNLDQMKYQPEEHDNYRSKKTYTKKGLSSLTSAKFSQKHDGKDD